MILAPTLTLNALRGPSVDPDAAAFAAASGATDVAALSAFVKGVKDLGLWESMVCWPLRSTQNAGTGTTAYSLGGLSSGTGTLVNGPTWGADGITFTPANSTFINTNYLTPQTTEFSAGGVVQQDVTGLGSVAVVSNDDIFPNRRWSRFTGSANSEVFDPDVRFINASEDNTNWKMPSLLYSTTEAVQLVLNTTNGNSISTLGYTMPANVHPLTLAGRWRPSTNVVSQGLSGIQAFAFYINKRIAITPFYTLYKQTLGTGLGLP